MMVNEYERDAVSDIILIIDSRSVSETGPVSRNSLVYSTRACQPIAVLLIQEGFGRIGCLQ